MCIVTNKPPRKQQACCILETASHTKLDLTFAGKRVHMSLLANPSHLEAVDPVVLGKVPSVNLLCCRNMSYPAVPVQCLRHLCVLNLPGPACLWLPGACLARAVQLGQRIRSAFVSCRSEMRRHIFVQVRAKQHYGGDEDRTKNLGVLLHGDGAFSGQVQLILHSTHASCGKRKGGDVIL